MTMRKDRLLNNISDYFAPAKRENNPNRVFIIVNKFQSKHYPSIPTVTAAEFSALGKALAALCPEGNTVVIGFAETACALGTFAAREFGERCFYVSTTREELPACFDRLSFEESHSHASHHTLCLRRPDLFRQAKQVFLVDDEFTTGHTAVNLANALRGYLSDDCVITAAALVASDESRRFFEKNGIRCVALHDFAGIFDSEFPTEFLPDKDVAPAKPDLEISTNALLDFRLGVNAAEYFAECTRICEEILPQLDGISAGMSVQVIATEEFCLPAILLGGLLEQRGCDVRAHSVTRSPMLPSEKAGYPINSRVRLASLYDEQRTVFLYNSAPCDVSIILTDAVQPSLQAVERLCGAAGGKRRVLVRWCGTKMRSSIQGDDAVLLLKDITGRVKPLSAKEREPLIQAGTHYCELLPAEFQPSAQYIAQYEKGLECWAGATAAAVQTVAEEIYRRKGKAAVLVSLARAGTPVGMLIKRYIKRRFGADIAHYSISIIRGRGIDKNAMDYILARHEAQSLQFVDGWTGKGAIVGQLNEALADYPQVDNRLAVLADPAGLCDLCGTHEDIFIPCSCLNSVVSGLFSRTVLRSGVISPHDFHGAAYFGELAPLDRTYEFINAVEREMTDSACPVPQPKHGGGLAETEEIARDFGVADINLVKPGIGETTRVLLRRIPKLVLVRDIGSTLTAHIVELAAEKGVQVREYPLRNYMACGLIQALGDV